MDFSNVANGVDVPLRASTVVGGMGMGGEDTDGERIACCRRCAAAILNKWDAVLEAARLEGV